MARKPVSNLQKKVASLSALGAGALVLGAGRADAGIIYSGVIDAHVGFTSGNQFFASPGIGPGSAFFTLSARSSTRSRSGSRRIMAYGCGCLRIAQQAGLLQLFSQNAQWNSGLIAGSTMLVGGRVWFHYITSTPGGGTTPVPFGTKFGNDPFDHKYALFTFDFGPDTFYGWMQLSYAVTSGFGTDPSLGPELILHDFAYDDTGALIQAGQTTEIPEPATAATTGLAALALGAAGLRQWRRSRKAA